MPNIRAFAFRRWYEASCPQNRSKRHAAVSWSEEADTFWDWALVELLVQSGLRIEEASELTTLDILKRQLPDGRVYYLLHIKPSKFDRARVIPIGDGLGRVIAEIIRHVKRFYGADGAILRSLGPPRTSPAPRAPYLLQGAKHPSPLGIQTNSPPICGCYRRPPARGDQMAAAPRSCRTTAAASLPPSILNNNMPVHVIQALLGHATLDTVMVYAKLYPTT